MFQTEHLQEKGESTRKYNDLPEINDSHRKIKSIVILENQESQ